MYVPSFDFSSVALTFVIGWYCTSMDVTVQDPVPGRHLPAFGASTAND